VVGFCEYDDKHSDRVKGWPVREQMREFHVPKRTQIEVVSDFTAPM
jgi:hypothetical protein